MPHDSTAETAQPLFGDKLYQQRARLALPILVRQATAGQSITYGDLANELAMPNPRNLNYVLGSIGQALISIGDELNNKDVPPIQCLVINQATGLPGEGVGWFFDKADFKQLTTKQKRAVVDFQLHKIFSYPEWDTILAALDLSPLPIDHSAALKAALQFTAGGESEHHKKLKETIAAHPEMIGLPKTTKPGMTEYGLPSGDSLDIFFQRRDLWVAVEVKSHISDNADITRGMFQCIKYQAVLEAMSACLGRPQNVRVLLAVGCPFPLTLVPLRNVLGVEVLNVAQDNG